MADTYKRLGPNVSATISGPVTVTGEVSVEPSDNFDAQTLTVTTTPQTLTWSGNPSAILIKALKENPGYVRIRKTGQTGTNYYLMDPGEPLTVPISNATTIDYDRDAGAGTYQITTIAVYQ